MGKHTDEWNDLNDAEQSKRGYTLSKKLDAIKESLERNMGFEPTELTKAWNEIYAILSEAPEEVKLSEETEKTIIGEFGPSSSSREVLIAFLTHDLPKAIERHMEKRDNEAEKEIISRSNEISKPHFDNTLKNPNL